MCALVLGGFKVEKPHMQVGKARKFLRGGLPDFRQAALAENAAMTACRGKASRLHLLHSPIHPSTHPTTTHIHSPSPLPQHQQNTPNTDKVEENKKWQSGDGKAG